jgi:hypothetical protein
MSNARPVIATQCRGAPRRLDQILRPRTLRSFDVHTVDDGSADVAFLASQADYAAVGGTV